MSSEVNIKINKDKLIEELAKRVSIPLTKHVAKCVEELSGNIFRTNIIAREQSLEPSGNISSLADYACYEACFRHLSTFTDVLSKRPRELDTEFAIIQTRLFRVIEELSNKIATEWADKALENGVASYRKDPDYKEIYQ